MYHVTTKKHKHMTQEELDEYARQMDGRKAEREAIITILADAGDLTNVSFDIQDFEFLSHSMTTATIRRWIGFNSAEPLSVSYNKIDGRIDIYRNNMKREKFSVTHTELLPENHIDIYARIEMGLKEDYIEPDTKHIWHVKDYLEGKTDGIVVTYRKRYLGTAFPSVIDAGEYARVRKFDAVPHMQKMHQASSTGSKRRYC